MNSKHIRTFGLLIVLQLVTAVISGCRPRTEDSQTASYIPRNDDWSAIQAKKQKEFKDYIARRPVSWAWFNESPLGFNGVPLVVLRSFVDFFPDIWLKDGSLDHLGFPPHSTDYNEDGTLRAKEKRLGLPAGFVWEEDKTETNPKKQTLNVFFSCAGCHTGRVIVGNKVKYIPGGPGTEQEAQYYAMLLRETASRLISNSSPDPTLSKPNQDNLNKFYAYLTGVRADIASGKKSPAYFFGGRIYNKANRTDYKALALSELDKVLEPSHYQDVMKGVIGSYGKVDILYNRLAANLMYSGKEGIPAPPLNFSKPGQMDPWGVVQGNIVLNALREDASWLAYMDQRYKNTPEIHDLIFAGNTETDPKKRYGKAAAQIVRNGFGLLARKEQDPSESMKDMMFISQWYAKKPANIDIKPLWNSKDEVRANWDGNQGESARVLASGVSSVGDPRKVNTRIHAAMNPFISDLPSPAYPFAVDLARAEKGKPLFESNCTGCHFPRNAKLYDIKTDRNRLLPVGPLARAGLVGLTMEACDIGRKRDGGARKIDDFDIAEDWCGPKEADESDLYAHIDLKTETRDGGVPLGYKADTLAGVWAAGPFLHNGSVPTLWHLLQTADKRPKKFVRGNINYDQKLVGFVWDKEPKRSEYPKGEMMHFTVYDTALGGNSNTGHEHGVQLSDEEKMDLMEYMKTL